MPSPFGNDFAPWLGVFETLRVVVGKPLFFAEHRAELTRAMTRLGLTTETNFATEGARLPTKSGRWRWVVTRNETRTIFSEEPSPVTEPIALSVSPVRLGSENWDARFKTLSYLAHAQASKLAATPEVLLLNERGHVASAAHANVFWRKGEKLFTPAPEAGCRQGITRGFVLQQQNVEQGHYSLAELMAADEIFLTNSMKGIVSVNKIANRDFDSFPAADGLREAFAGEILMRLQNRLPMEHW
jgi:branched-chain amino acid aminotransferase/4-amino-4-deoxychorismate lyase